MTQQIPLIEEIGNPQERRDDDFYETPIWQTEVLLPRVVLSTEWRILEPCAGNLAIVRVLRRHGFKVWANDLYERDYQLDSTYDMTKRESWDAVREHMGGRIDAVIANLPFNLAFPLLELAVPRVPFVTTILNRTFDEPTEKRCEWLAAHPTAAQFVLPRWAYRGTGSPPSTTAWFTWTRYRAVLRKTYDVITWRERDELIARYGAAA